jgi:IS5 family transposase
LPGLAARPGPDAKTILKIANALGPAVIAQLHQRVVALAIDAGVTTGRRLRVDTTVVETNIHHPTDSSLLADGVRVVTLVVKTLEALVGRGRRAMRDRARSVTRRVLEIQYAARSPKTRDRLGVAIGACWRRLARCGGTPTRCSAEPRSGCAPSRPRRGDAWDARRGSCRR